DIGAMQRFLGEHAFFREDERAQRHLLCRTVQQMRIAVRTDSALIGDQFFRDISNLLAPIIHRVLGEDSLGSKSPLALDSADLPVIGLDFAPSSVEAFAVIRQSEEITSYAAGFREALAKAAESGSPREHMLSLMREAMDHERIANLVAGGFETAGSILNLGGLVPVFGTVT